MVVQSETIRGGADAYSRQAIQADDPLAFSSAHAALFGGAFELNEPFMLASADHSDDLSTRILKGPRVASESRNFSVLVSLCQKAVPDCVPLASSVEGDGEVRAVVEVSAVNESTPGLLGAAPFSIRELAPGIAHGSINRNLHTSLTDAGVPGDVVEQLELAWSGRVAMRAAARPGDRFTVRYERVTTRGKNAAVWRLVAAELRLRGERHTAVWFAAPGRPNGHYYAFDGHPLAERRFSMPVAYKRISSRFGMRQHPLSGAQHGHSGTDFAAPTGTPVSAAAAGIVQRVAYEGGMAAMSS
ncbi:hypothetical protein BamMEX5DRAFT_1364 [Burkholderia ambifaria MEX-5]|uniref:Uncharacterized protein n=1 Tax=Burkholderia ambifaria MEX-5 TaxID=396597 RepID=B1T0P8_9BURK|nr:hypothetical protein BamMEX5DRAFT_1364 [Burkholderia ambifaria MEX-5]